MNEQLVKRPSRTRVRFLKLLRRKGDIKDMVDTDYLLKTYPELFAGVDAEDADDLVSAYIEIVSTKAIDPNPFFSELAYLAHNRDAARQVESRQFQCGFHHWLEGGQAENRIGWAKRRQLPDADIPVPASDRFGAPHFLLLWALYKGEFRALTSEQAANILRRSGVVDFERYAALYPDLVEQGIDPIQHYVGWGYKERRRLHPFFDDGFYLEQVPELRAVGIPPILHYLLVGAAAGCNPHPLIDSLAYARQHDIELADTNPLIHYTMSPGANLVATPHFDEDYYVRNHPESAEFPDGPFHHFTAFGVYSGYKPNPGFNPRYYYATHLQGDFSRNAYDHYILEGHAQGLATDLAEDERTLPRDVRFFSNPGPDFEALDPDIAKGQARRGKIISFYLPQFHAFPENDDWWGRGFTEWRNLPRGIPRYVGHYQPRIPRDLSFYDLTDTNVMRRQIDMAKSMGIWGFAYYFYWFNRHRLMESPLDTFLADPSMDMPFMLIWANENWTRRWDGAESEVLIRQDHLPEDDEALVDCFQKYFSDNRYIRLNGRPLLVIYRADIIPDTVETIEKWRALFETRHGERPLIYLAQTFGAEDPHLYGFDGAIEFPPHKIGRTITEINRDLKYYDWDFEGSVRRYPDAISHSLDEEAPSFPLVKTVFPSWDNNARRQTGGMVFDGATPALFGKWLDGALDFAHEHPVEGEEIVFVNAWNEWAEGAYLEPDVHFGGAMLNRLAATVTATGARKDGKFKVLLIGHDAFPAGAQRNLLAMAKTLQNRFGVEIQVVLLGDGDMLPLYQDAVPTLVCGQHNLAETLRSLASQGYRKAILNTVVSGLASQPLKDLGFRVVSLVHELPQIIDEYKLAAHADTICRHADDVVFPSEFVRDAFVGKAGSIDGTIRILPQGIYQRFERDRTVRGSMRSALGIPDHAPVVLNVGYGDLRKGVDIFCQIAHLSFDRGLDMHFIWAGDIHPSLKAWLVGDLSRKGITNLHFLGERRDVPDLMNAADVLFLSSREDPFPSVVLEAMQVGLPVVAFENNGGFVDLIAGDPRLGTLVPQADMGVIVTELMRWSRQNPDSDSDVAHRIARARDEFDFNDYAFGLLQLLDATLKRISVVVPNYNYSAYLSARLGTIFAQSYPIYETIVLDDASTDDSLTELARIADKTGRGFDIVPSEVNGGSAFGQWQKAAERARGEFVWIAEADDLSAPGFLERLMEELATDGASVLGFSDSRSVDSDGYTVYDSYIPYAESIAPGVLNEDRIFSTREFVGEALSTANLILNVSSVVWRKDALLSAFRMAGDEALKLKVAGDWRLYLAACGVGGSVVYIADQLNIHRRHATSVTAALAADAHVAEIETLHDVVNRLVGADRETDSRQRKYVSHVRDWLRAGQ